MTAEKDLPSLEEILFGDMVLLDDDHAATLPPDVDTYTKTFDDHEFEIHVASAESAGRVVADWRDVRDGRFTENPGGGKKETGGKRSNHGVPVESVWDLSDHMMRHALGKYGHGNYQKGMRLSQFIDAIESHVAALRRGELVDAATGESHVEAIGANWLMINVCRRLGTLNVDVGEVYAEALTKIVQLTPDHPALSRTPWYGKGK